MKYTLKWEPVRRDMVLDKRTIRKEVRSAFDECLSRIPEIALATIAAYRPEPLEVVLHCDDDRPAGTAQSATKICLCVPRANRHELIWIIAHELAHCYWFVITWWARNHLISDFEQRSYKLREPQKRDLLRALVLKEANAPDPGMLGETRTFMERLADTIAISWGFEREYAEHLDPAILRDTAQTTTDYFDLPLAKIVEILQRRTDESSALAVKQARELIRMITLARNAGASPDAIEAQP